MKNSKKNTNSAGQNTTGVRKSRKHDANLQKNSTLYFQIGLILCLLGTYSLLEMQFLDKQIVPETVTIDEVALIDVPPVYQIEKIQPKKPEPKTDRSTIIKDKIEVRDDDLPELEDDLFPEDDMPQTDAGFDLEGLPGDDDPEDEPILVPFKAIQIVPVYPGCERKKTNEARKKCMSSKINKLIHRKFNTNIARDNGITGLRRIQTRFTIDKFGNVTDIQIRAPHPVLEKEALRVIRKIPHMEPGIQRDKPVGVIFDLDIKFLIEN